MNQIISYLRQAFKSLKRAPGYTAAFVLTLGLAVGVNSAVFSMVNGVILKPLPYQNAERLVYLKQPIAASGVENVAFSFMEIDDLRAQSAAFDEFVEFGDWDFTVIGDWEPHRAVGGLVNANYFSTLGMRPAMGRLLNADDDRQGAEPVVILTDAYWRRMFGGDPAIVGKVLDLSSGTGQPPLPTRVIGVLEPGIHYTGSRQQDFYVNYAANGHYQGSAMRDARNHRMTDVFARLAPGATIEGARSELATIANRLHSEYPETYLAELGFGLEATPWHEELTRDARGTFLFLMASVGVILLLAAANVTNLTLTRLIRKQGELSTRTALGASEFDLRMRVTTEHVILGFAGGVLGVLFALLAHDSLVSYASRFTVRAQEVGVDWQVLLLALGGGMLLSGLLAWLPGLPVAPGIESVASAQSKATASKQRKQLQRGLVVAQLALSFTLLTGAGLLVRSLLEMSNVPPGFQTENILTAESPDGAFGPNLTNDGPVFEQALDEIRAYPGVRSAAVARWLPLGGDVNPTAMNVMVDGREDDGDLTYLAATNEVSPGYFETLEIPLLEGRYIDESDRAETRPVVVLNEEAARTHFGETPAVGRRISFEQNGPPGFFGAPPRVDYEIVGVVADSKEYGIGEEGVQTFYRPAAQTAWGPNIIVAAQGDTLALAAHIRDVIHGIRPERAVEQFATMGSLWDNNVAPSRLNALLFGSLAGLALLIAAVGVFGALAFSVSQRFREFGIRMALGADREIILRNVLGEAGLLMAIALVIGIAATLMLSRFLAASLFGVGSNDPLTMAGAAAALTVVALLAALLPAARATRIPPAEALRPE